MNYQNPYYQYQMPLQNMVQQPVQNQQPQIQNGGFISVRSIDEARNYPVAPGNAVTFKIEGQPFVAEKTLGYSQFESPIFKIFKLVETDGSDVITPTTAPSSPEYILKSEFESCIAELQAQIEALKEPPKTVTKVGRKRKEDLEDDAE